MIGWVLLAFALVAAPAWASGRFADQPPVWAVEDTIPIPAPEPSGWNRYQSFIDQYWLQPVDDVLSLRSHPPAADVNSREEVPASSWFTPRNGLRPLPPEVVSWGNVAESEIDRSVPLRIIEARLEGPEPFAIAVEGSGRHVVLEFDDSRYPEVRTAAIIVASRLLHAAGYNVLPSFIDEILISDLSAEPDARRVSEFGKTGALDPFELQEFLSRLAPEGAGGSIRVAASRLPEGRVIGGFAERGTRSDDANDRIPHEDRRSLRGLRVFAAWLDHTRMRTDRTLDVYLEPQGFLRHYLTGLGATLGARMTHPHPGGMEGREPYVDWIRWLRNWGAMGFGDVYAARRGATRFGGVGDLGVRGFDPPRWRPAYAYEPFRRADWADAFWGVRGVTAFTDEQIRAAVEAGHLSNPAATNYLTGVLAERRDRIGWSYLAEINAADNFRVVRSPQGRYSLTVEDLGITRGLKHPQDVQYVLEFRLPDLGETLGLQARGGDRLEFDLMPFLPADWRHRDDPSRYGVAALCAYDARGRRAEGETRVHIYFDAERGPRIIGVERG